MTYGRSLLFAKKPISKALFSLFPESFNSEYEAKIEFVKYGEKIELSSSKLAKKITDHIKLLEKSGEPSPHIVFIIDEMGQYIGDSDDLLLELQKLSEDFGRIGLGRIWLIITSQEKLDQVIEGVKIKQEGYKKIMDRFETKLHLTSENIVAVLEERILKKKETAIPEISSIYLKYQGAIAYASKLEGANHPLIECTPANFITSYPFLPYQLEITQQIFANIRSLAGHSIKLTGAERSMLGVTQGILKSPETGFKTSDTGRLVAFDEIFDQIKTEISGDIQRDINEIKIPEKGDIILSRRAMKTLFLLQQLRWVPKSLTNISRAMVSSSNVISGAKKLIEEEISVEPVKNHEIKRFASDLLTNLIDFGRLNYEGVKYFDINVFADDNELSSKGDISLKVYSPIFLEFKAVEKASVLESSHKSLDTVFWLSNPDIKIENDIKKYLRTQKVIERRDKNEKKSAEEIAILREKRESLGALRSGIESSIKQALLSGNIIYDGNDEVLTGKTENIKTVFEKELNKVVPFIYTKFDDAKFKVSEKSIAAILTAKSNLNQIEKDLDLFDDKGNLNLHGKILSEVYSKIEKSHEKASIYTGADLLDEFEEVPYGWDVILVRIAVAALFRGGAIYLKSNGESFIDFKKPGAADLLVNSNKFKKAVLCIEPEVKIELEDREKIQQELNVIFDIRSDDTINSLCTSIDNQITAMKNEYDRQEIFWEQNELELKPEFYMIRETCKNILNENNPARKLKKFHELAGETKKEFTYLKKVKDFTSREDKKLLAKIKKLPASINVSSQTIDSSIIEGYRSFKNEIDTIISKKEIVEKWTVALENYNRAVEAYKQVYEILHSQSYAIYDNMKKEISKDPALSANIKGDTFTSINDFLCSENSWVAEDLACNKCGYSLSELDNHILAKDTIRDKLILKLTPKKPEEKRIHVNLRSSTGKSVIKTEGDLKQALSNIEKKVKVHLDKGETVILQ